MRYFCVLFTSKASSNRIEVVPRAEQCRTCTVLSPFPLISEGSKHLPQDRPSEFWTAIWEIWKTSLRIGDLGIDKILLSSYHCSFTGLTTAIAASMILMFLPHYCRTADQKMTGATTCSSIYPTTLNASHASFSLHASPLARCNSSYAS